MTSFLVEVVTFLVYAGLVPPTDEADRGIVTVACSTWFLTANKECAQKVVMKVTMLTFQTKIIVSKSLHILTILRGLDGIRATFRLWSRTANTTFLFWTMTRS
jgi:hypothetical protein